MPPFSERTRLSRALVALLTVVAIGLGTTLVATTTEAATANLVKNPGLETDANGNGVPDGWTTAGSGVNTYAVSAAAKVHSGTHAFKVAITNYTSGNRKLLAAYDTGGVPVTVGARYDLSGWYRTNGDAMPVVFRRDSSGAWTSWASSGYLPRSNSYARWSFTTPAVPSGTVALSFGLALKSVGWLTTDDYAMSPGSSGTTTTTAPPSPSGGVLVEDHFARPNGIISNEYAFWSPGAADARNDAIWQLNSGSLFAKDGTGFTGRPDDIEPNAVSSNGNDSAILRLLTKRADLTNIDVSFRLRHEAFVTTPSTPSVDWDGVHVFLRYADEENLYYASVDRRDGTTQIKKKVSGGPSNGGTYYVLGSGKSPVPTGVWQSVRATIQDQADGSVAINLYADGRLVASAVDRGTGGPVVRTGHSGIRGDNSQFSIDDFVVRGL